MYVNRILLALACVLVYVSSTRAQQNFESRIDYAVGRSPQSISVADFNGDGNLDVAVGNSDSTPNTVSILLGFGDGTFASAVFYGIGSESGPCNITAADVNGDGKTDLVVASWNSNSISVLMNQGDGIFASAVSFPGGDTLSSVCAADLNGDGAVDLVAPCFSSDSVAIFNNSGSGTYPTWVKYAVGRRPYSAIAVDFNSDGKPDLAVVNKDTDPTSFSTVSILLNNGDGTFAHALSYTVGQNALAVSAADLNGDGAVDLATVIHYSGGVYILFGNGDGTFANGVYCNAAPYPVSISIADFNNDGAPDLVVANPPLDSLTILPNPGNGIFASYATVIQAGTGPVAVSAADFNGDGMPDLAVANSADGTVSILKNGGMSVCFDTDHDGFGDPDHLENLCPVDNCSSVYNLDQADWNHDGTGDACTYTPIGKDVSVQLTANIGVTYDSVSSVGTTGLTSLPAGPNPDPLANLGVLPLGTPHYYDISSSASFDTVIVCIAYADSDVVGDESLIRMMHYVDSSWVDITSSLDTATNTICGKTTSFSFFALMGPCCFGNRGNIDCDPNNGVDISDLTTLIDYLYVSFTPLCCSGEANVDGSPDGHVDISDLTALIDYLYISFTPPAACQ